LIGDVLSFCEGFVEVIGALRDTNYDDGRGPVEAAIRWSTA